MVLISQHELHSIARLGECLVLTFVLLKGNQTVIKDHRDEPLYFKTLGRENVRRRTP